MSNGLNIAVIRIARYLLSCFASHVNIHPSILSALQPWVSLGFLNNQPPLLSIFYLLHPLLCLHYLQVCYIIIHPSISSKVFLPSSFSALLPLPLSLHVPAIYPLSFYKFHNILSIYGSI